MTPGCKEYVDLVLQMLLLIPTLSDDAKDRWNALHQRSVVIYESLNADEHIAIEDYLGTYTSTHKET